MTIQNPYHTLSPKLKTALDYIIANMQLNPTFPSWLREGGRMEPESPDRTAPVSMAAGQAAAGMSGG